MDRIKSHFSVFTCVGCLEGEYKIETDECVPQERNAMQVLEGLQGGCVIADDILITGEGDTQEVATKNQNENLRYKCI